MIFIATLSDTSNYCPKNRVWEQDRIKGFTLLEILIAITLLSLIFSIVLPSYTGTARIIKEVEYQADIYEMARITLERIKEDLESIYLKEGNRIILQGDNREINDKQGDFLRFRSRVHLPLDYRKGVKIISYYIKEHSDKKELSLYRTSSFELEEDLEEEKGGHIICDNLLSINYTFFDDSEQEYDYWDTEKMEFINKKLTRILIFLEFANENNPEAPYLFMTGVAFPADIYNAA